MTAGGAPGATPVLYADTSALVRAYFQDEDEHEALREALLGSDEPVVTSELARVEFCSAAAAAFRARRVASVADLLARFDQDTGADGPVFLLRLRPAAVLGLARRLVVQHRLHTLDAIHLAVAATDGVALAAGDPLVFVSRDPDQLAAASALGLATR